MMGIIRKCLKPLRNVLVGIILLLGTLVALLHLPSVRRYLLAYLSHYIERTTRYHISCEEVGLNWFRYVTLKHIHVIDPQKKTLLTVDQCKGRLNIGSLLLLRPDVIDSIEVNGIALHLEEDQAHNWNMAAFYRQVILPFLPKIQKDLYIKHIQIDEGKLYYANESKKQFFTLTQLHLQIKHFLSTAQVDTGTVASFSYQADDKFPLICQSFNVQYTITPCAILLKDCQLVTSYSMVKGDFHLKNEQQLPFGVDWHPVVLEMVLHETALSLDELGFFLPFLRPLHGCYQLDGKIVLTQDRIAWYNCKLAFGNSYTRSTGSYDNSDQQPMVELFVQEGMLYTNDLSSYFQQRVALNPWLTALEYLQLSACTFKGNRQQAKLTGDVVTNIGRMQPNLTIANFGHNEEVTYVGHIVLDQVAMHTLFPMLPIVAISADVSLVGKGIDFNQLSLEATANIPTLTAATYVYKEIVVYATLANAVVTFHVHSKDPAAKLNLTGSYAFAGKLNVRGMMEQMDLNKLGWITSPLTVATQFTLDLYAMATAFPRGKLVLNKFYIQFQGKKLSCPKITLCTWQQDGLQRLAVISPWLDVKLQGAFTMRSLRDHVQYLYAQFKCPSMGVVQPLRPVRLDYTICCKNLSPLLKWCSHYLYISPATTIQGYCNYDTMYHCALHLPFAAKICFQQFNFIKTKVEAVVDNITDPAKRFIACTIVSEKQDWYKKHETKDLNLKFSLQNDAFTFSHTLSSLAYASTLSIACSGRWVKDMIQIAVLPSTFTTQEKIWAIQATSPTFIDRKAQSITIGDLSISSGNESISIGGRLAKTLQDATLRCMVRNVRVDSEVSQLGKRCEGVIDATLTTGLVDGHLLTTGIVHLQACRLAHHLIGNFVTKFSWHTWEHKLFIEGSLTKEERCVGQLHGTYNLAKQLKNKWNMTVLFQQMDIWILNLLIPVLSDIEGNLSGKFQLGGDFHTPTLNGHGTIDKAKFKINYLNTLYCATGKIAIRENVLHIDQFYLSDTKTGYATLSGYFSLKEGWPLMLTCKVKNLHLLDIQQSHNAEFYGTLYATGTVQLTGCIHDLTITMRGRAHKGSFTMLAQDRTHLEDAMQLVRFIYPKHAQEPHQNAIAPPPANPLMFKLLLDLTIQPTVDIEVLLGSNNSKDRISGKGEGKIHLEVGTSRRPYIKGNYIFQQGTFTISVYHIIQKKFTISPGSQVTFNGYPQEGIAQVEATYLQKVSVRNLYPESKDQRAIPVTIKLSTYGVLAHPQFSYDLDFPIQGMDVNLNAALEVCKRRASLDKHYLGRQVLSLLIAKRFLNEESINGWGAFSASINDWIVRQVQNVASTFSPNLVVEADLHPWNTGINDPLQRTKVVVSYWLTDYLKFTKAFRLYSALYNDWEIAYQFSRLPNLHVKLYQQPLEDNDSRSLSGLGVSYTKKFGK